MVKKGKPPAFFFLTDFLIPNELKIFIIKIRAQI